MKRGTFRNLLIFVAIVAIIYSPSTLTFSAQSNPLTNAQSGMSHFVSYLQGRGYHVQIANTSAQLSDMLARGPATYILICPDTPLSQQEQQRVVEGFQIGNLSLLIGAGNTTDNNLLGTFGASVSGHAISDPTSVFQDQRIFTVQMSLGGGTTSGVIDVASPLTLSLAALAPAASSSPLSTDSGSSAQGPRVVAATGGSNAGTRVLVITNSAPFTNQLMLPASSGPNDTAFVESMVSWVTASTPSKKVVLDNAHYTAPHKGPSIGLPVGVLGSLLLQGMVSSVAGPFGFTGTGGLGNFSIFGIPSIVFSIAFAFLALLFIRRIIKRYFASEKVQRDDQPLPGVEKTVVAESKERTDFLSLTRKKSFYVATCAQLYDVVDDISKLEFGEGIATLSPQKLAARVGDAEAAKTLAFLKELSRIYAYAIGKGGMMLPPILRWKHKVEQLTAQAEGFLNRLGMSMTGEGQAKAIEYALRR